MLIPLYQQTTSRHSEVSGVIDHLAEGVWYHWLVVVESGVIGWHPFHEFGPGCTLQALLLVAPWHSVSGQ